MQLGVDRPTAELDERIARRVARMLAAGLVDETRGLLPGLREGSTAAPALGYHRSSHLAGRLEGAAADTVRRDPPLRPPPGVVVPPRPAGPLAAGESSDVGDRALAAIGASVR